MGCRMVRFKRYMHYESVTYLIMRMLSNALTDIEEREYGTRIIGSSGWLLCFLTMWRRVRNLRFAIADLAYGYITT